MSGGFRALVEALVCNRKADRAYIAELQRQNTELRRALKDACKALERQTEGGTRAKVWWGLFTTEEMEG